MQLSQTDSLWECSRLQVASPPFLRQKCSTPPPLIFHFPPSLLPRLAKNHISPHLARKQKTPTFKASSDKPYSDKILFEI